MSIFIVNKEDISVKSTIKCISYKSVEVPLDGFLSTGCEDMEEYFDNCPEDWSLDDEEVDEHEEEWSVVIPGALSAYDIGRKRTKSNNRIEGLRIQIKNMFDLIEHNSDDVADIYSNLRTRLKNMLNSLGEMYERPEN